MVIKRIHIRELERGFLFVRGEFRRTLRPGTHWLWDPLFRIRVDVVSTRNVFLSHPDLQVLEKADAFNGPDGPEARILDLKDHQRALVFVDGRFAAVLNRGLHVLWTVFHEVEVEVVDARQARFQHEKLHTILDLAGVGSVLERVVIESGQVGLFFLDGDHRTNLGPGVHAFWKGVGRVEVIPVDKREQVLDVVGQDIMTADKVTLRLNAAITFRVVDPLRSVSVVEDARQALYREVQLALRAVVGTRELDTLLSDKDAVASELEGAVRRRVENFGLSVLGLGIRDVILPGDMKDLLNRVTEAKKAAEASLITRREETAAMRSQANTARILESNPTLMRLRELEVLEKVADKANLTVVLGEQGLSDRVVKLL